MQTAQHESAFKALDAPGAESVEPLEFGKVDVDAARMLVALRRVVDDSFDLGGVLGRPGSAAASARRSPLVVALSETGLTARRAAPRAEIVVDANEGWNPDDFEHHIAACADAGVALIEQPLPVGRDEALVE